METQQDVRQTSKDAYHNIRANGVAATQFTQIINFLKEMGRPVTRRQIAQATGIESSSVSGRVHTLINAKEVYEPYTDKCPISGINVNYVALVRQGHQQKFDF